MMSRSPWLRAGTNYLPRIRDYPGARMLRVGIEKKFASDLFHHPHHLPSTMEPTPKALAVQTQDAVDASPACYQLEPQDGELVDNPASSYVRL